MRSAARCADAVHGHCATRCIHCAMGNERRSAWSLASNTLLCKRAHHQSGCASATRAVIVLHRSFSGNHERGADLHNYLHSVDGKARHQQTACACAAARWQRHRLRTRARLGTRNWLLALLETVLRCPPMSTQLLQLTHSRQSLPMQVRKLVGPAARLQRPCQHSNRNVVPSTSVTTPVCARRPETGTTGTSYPILWPLTEGASRHASLRAALRAANCSMDRLKQATNTGRHLLVGIKVRRIVFLAALRAAGRIMQVVALATALPQAARTALATCRADTSWSIWDQLCLHNLFSPVTAQV